MTQAIWRNRRETQDMPQRLSKVIVTFITITIFFYKKSSSPILKMERLRDSNLLSENRILEPGLCQGMKWNFSIVSLGCNSLLVPPLLLWLDHLSRQMARFWIFPPFDKSHLTAGSFIIPITFNHSIRRPSIVWFNWVFPI